MLIDGFLPCMVLMVLFTLILMVCARFSLHSILLCFLLIFVILMLVMLCCPMFRAVYPLFSLLTFEECLSALLGMARRKALGNDGFPMEFYLKFWHILGSDLVDVLNACFANIGRKNTMCSNFRENIVS